MFIQKLLQRLQIFSIQIPVLVVIYVAITTLIYHVKRFMIVRFFFSQGFSSVDSSPFSMLRRAFFNLNKDINILVQFAKIVILFRIPKSFFKKNGMGRFLGCITREQEQKAYASSIDTTILKSFNTERI